MINEMIQNWIDSVDLNMLKNKICNRKVYIWGAYEQGRYILDFLQNQGFLINAFVDTNKANTTYNNIQVYDPKDLKHNSDNIFVIVPIIGRRSEIITLLIDYGYNENIDYIYIYHKIIISSISGFYSDAYGNMIISKEEIKNIKICLEGCNNKLFIGDKFFCTAIVNITLKYGSTLVMGNNFRCSRGTLLINDGGKICFGDNCNIGYNFYIACYSGSITVGNRFTVYSDFYMISDKDAPIEIGDDCQFSNGIRIRSDNGHSIFDLENKINISLAQKHYVIIRNHVWVGMAVNILYNSDISENIVVGANSLVKGSYPPNCIIAGNVAKVIRENINWDRQNNLSYEEFISKMS